MARSTSPTKPVRHTGAPDAIGVFDLIDDDEPEIQEIPGGREETAVAPSATAEGDAVSTLAPELVAASPTPGPNPNPPAEITYRSRIAIIEAWRYAGALADAPPWIDRSWAAWADLDERTGQRPGPCLRVPVASHMRAGDEAVCRVGDYVVRQCVSLADGIEETGVEVWPQADFHRLFMPVKANAEGNTA